MTTKYGDLLLRQKYADLKALAQDHDMLAGPLDNKDLATAHSKHMQALLKQIDWIVAVHKKEYPNAPPLDEEEEEQPEQGNADAPVGPDEAMEDGDDTDGEQINDDETPMEAYGQEDQDTPAPATDPISQAVAGVSTDADTMNGAPIDDAIPAPTNRDRYGDPPYYNNGQAPSGIEAVGAMRRMAENAKGMKDCGDIDKEVQELLHYLDGGHGSTDLLDGPRFLSPAKVNEKQGYEAVDRKDKDEKAIVRMVQVKEHMRKLPQRKKLTCPGCGQQDCNCDKEDDSSQPYEGEIGHDPQQDVYGDPNDEFDHEGLDLADIKYGDPEEEAEEFGEDEEWPDIDLIKSIKARPLQIGDSVRVIGRRQRGVAPKEGHIIDTHEDPHQGTLHTVHFPKWGPKGETGRISSGQLEYTGSASPTIAATSHQPDDEAPVIRSLEPLRSRAAQRQRAAVAEATYARNLPKDREDFLARKRAVSRAMAATEEWNALSENERESLTPLISRKPSPLARRGVPPPLPSRSGPPSTTSRSGPPPLPSRSGPPSMPHKFKVGDTVRTRNGDVVTIHGTHMDREGKPTYSISHRGQVVGHPNQSGRAALLYEGNFAHHDPKNEEHIAAAASAKQGASERRAVREARQHREQQRSGFGATGGWLAPGATATKPAKPTETPSTSKREQDPRQRRQFVDQPGAASGMTRRQVSAGGWLGANKPKSLFDEEVKWLDSLQEKNFLDEDDKFLAFHYGKMLEESIKSNHFHKDVEGDDPQEGHYPGQQGHGEMLDSVYATMSARAPQKAYGEVSPVADPAPSDSLNESVKDLLASLNGTKSAGKPVSSGDDNSSKPSRPILGHSGNMAEDEFELTYDDGPVDIGNYGPDSKSVKDLLASLNGTKSAGKPLSTGKEGKPTAAATTRMGGQMVAPPPKVPKNSPANEEVQQKSLDRCMKFFFRMAREKNFGDRHKEEAKEVLGVLSAIEGAVAKREKTVDWEAARRAIRNGQQAELESGSGLDADAQAAWDARNAAMDTLIRDPIRTRGNTEDFHDTHEYISDTLLNDPNVLLSTRKELNLNSLVKQLQETLAHH